MKRIIILLLLCLATPAFAETVDVKYRGPVDLKPFACQSVSKSSFINRVCYDAANQYMVILLKDTYYHYCELPKSTLDALMAAPSMGQYFNANIKGTGKDGPTEALVSASRVPARHRIAEHIGCHSIRDRPS